MTPTRVLVAVTAVLLLASAAPGRAATVNISVGDNFFNPPNPIINQGDVVMWNWVGGSPHSIRSGACSPSCAFDTKFSSGNAQSSGHFTSQPFNTPGAFPYFCGVHLSSMKGSITVQASNPLICNPMADHPVGNPPLTVQFMANPGGGTPPYTFSWDFADGTAADPNRNPQHVFNALGTYDVTVTVTDSTAAMHICMTRIIVTSLICSATADPNTGDFPLDVTLTASASGGDPNYDFMWDLGDGSPMGMGEVVLHTYTTSGLKHVMLMVEDSMTVPCAAPILVDITAPNCVTGDNDADGICDASDNCVGVSNPSQGDLDGDGVGDVCDDCAVVYNPGQTDTDGDGLGSACDNCAVVYNPGQTDTDADGLGSACDDCLFNPDPNQIDTDMDGKGDACDLTITSPVERSLITDCNTSPMITWSPDKFDRFRVFLSWDPGFIKGRVVNSGDKLLKTTFWTPPLKRWRKACSNALTAGQGLYFKVFGKSRTTKATDNSDVVMTDVF